MAIDLDVAQPLVAGTDEGTTSSEPLLRDARDYEGTVGEFIAEVRLHRSYFCALVFDMLHDYYVADEVVQEAFVRAWQALLRYGRDGYIVENMRAWLTTIVAHAAWDYARRERSRLASVSLERSDDVLELQGSRFDRPDMVVEDLEGTAELRVLLGKLPERYRLAITLRYLGEYDYKEIAHFLRSDVALARVVVHRATKHFARVVKEARISEAALGRWLKSWESAGHERMAEDEEIEWWFTVDSGWYRTVLDTRSRKSDEMGDGVP